MEFTADQVREKAIKVIAYQMGIDEQDVHRESRFKEDIETDSLDDVEILMELEDEFEISISDDVAEKWKNVGDAIDGVSEVLKEHNQLKAK